MHNALLVRWKGGWTEVTDATSIAAHGRHEALLGLGVIPSLAEATRIGTEQLANWANPRTEIVAGVAPVDDTDTPYLAWNVSDTVLVPDIDGTEVREQVLALTVSEDENGMVTFAPELKDVIATEQERWEQATKKMIDGTMRGQAPIASPVAQAPRGVSYAQRPSTEYEAAFSAVGALVSQYSPPITTPVSCTLVEVLVTVRSTGPGFRVAVFRDGTGVWDGDVPADTALHRFTDIPAETTSLRNTTAWIVELADTDLIVADVNVSLRFR